jgi:hypothetical protein
MGTGVITMSHPDCDITLTSVTHRLSQKPSLGSGWHPTSGYRMEGKWARKKNHQESGPFVSLMTMTQQIFLSQNPDPSVCSLNNNHLNVHCTPWVVLALANLIFSMTV